MNILILSAGTRNKIVQYFRKELRGTGKVIATDANKLAPALYEADKYYIVPKISAPNYIDYILEICQENNVKGVLSLIDPELSILAKHKQRFIDIGTIPIVSNYDEIEKSFNKYDFSKYIETLGFKAIPTYKDLNEFKLDYSAGKISFPVFVKPIKGSASININQVDNFEQLKNLFKKYDDLIIQELMDGKEFGVDVYIDILTQEPVNIFIKEKILMKSGETDKSISVINSDLREMVLNFIEASNYQGVIDIDIFEKKGEYYISEVNPRFGGGYPHAYECGINIPYSILENLNKKNNIPNFEYADGIYMMKFNEVKILSMNTVN